MRSNLTGLCMELYDFFVAKCFSIVSVMVVVNLVLLLAFLLIMVLVFLYSACILKNRICLLLSAVSIFQGVIGDYSKLENKLNDHKMETQTPGTEGTKGNASINQANKAESSSRMEGSIEDDLNCVLNEKELPEGQVVGERGSLGNKENPAHIRDGHLTDLKQKEKELIDEVTVRTSELEHLERELELMNEAAEMVFNNQQSVDFYLDQLNEQVKAKGNYLLTLESEWDAVRKQLEERKRSLEESLYSNNPDALEMLQKLRQVQQEELFIISETIKREEEHLKLCADLEKQQKIASRKSYTDRIKEITKNSLKQDADIEQILKDTREVQLDSNSIQERLHRTYTVADEIVFREAKKDPAGPQVYRLLVSIHQGFEQISEKILATDRIRREIAEYEMKLAATTSRSLDVNELKANLDAIIRENEYP
ncbi:hypothetical protein VNO77_43178 [Canavalia gladiata]|uniref:CCDC22 coiled-coil domain-containing protein n=1 Tax=Canavalia gladiata TaxID=3824 RepID=A0AAN9JVV0_CANGL